MKKKAIIFDCDNTLWKGVVGEDSIVHDIELQKTAVMLAEHGVIVGLCSKNNEDDVLSALKDGVLTMDYISAYRINWKDKASNLKELIEELNIGADAVVFVDDSKFEISLIQDILPDIEGIYPYELNNKIVHLFDLTGSLLKTKQYKENYERAKAKEQFTDITEYLRSLDMVLSIKVNDRDSVPRISELTQKTNQFNLTTKRYSEQDICEWMEKGMVFSLSARDRFGDNGLTGVCIMDDLIVDTFLLSCRILGRKIEYAFLEYVMINMRAAGWTGIVGKYEPTQKNLQTKDFYLDMGFNPINTGNGVSYYLCNLDEYKPLNIDFFRYE